MAVPVAVSAPAQAACAPQDRSTSLQSVTLTDTTLSGYQTVRADFAGHLPDGSCAGDTVTISIPDELRTQDGTFDIRDPGGVLMGSMVIQANVVTLTFNDYVEMHINVSYEGFLTGVVSGQLQPSSHYDLEWTAGGTTLTTAVDTNDCPDCGEPRTEPRKFASYHDDTNVGFSLESAVTQVAGEVVTFTDVVGPGQEIDCSTLRGLAWKGRDAWGALMGGMSHPMDIVSCDVAAFTVRMVADSPGQYLGVQGRSRTTRALTHFQDTATFNQAGETDERSADAQVYAAGAAGDGETPVPAVDIEKWSTADGPVDGDHDDSAKSLDPAAPESISFTLTNTGTEVLTQVEVSDRTTAGAGEVQGLSCDFTPIQGPATGTSFAGPFAPGESFTCTGTLPALGPDATHTDVASVTAVGETSGTGVEDSDQWSGQTPPAPDVDTPPSPAVDIEKWSTVDGPVDGDHDDSAKSLDPAAPESISFTLTNTGTEVLTQVEVSDRTTAGTGEVQGLSCDFTPIQGPATGTSFAGPFAPGESFTCTGTLPALGPDATHTDVASVTAVGETSGSTVEDSDQWNADTRGQTDTSTDDDDTTTGTPHTLANTGAPPLLGLWFVVGVCLLAVGTLLASSGRLRTNLRTKRPVPQ